MTTWHSLGATRRHSAIAGLLLLLMAVLAGGAATHESITVDEVAHLGAGVSYLQKLDLRRPPRAPQTHAVLARDARPSRLGSRRRRKENLAKEEVANFRSWKSSDPKRFRRLIRKIIAFDLDVSENKADYLIGYWEGAGAQSGGTSGELTVALRKRIPAYLVASLPLEEGQRVDARLLGPGFHLDRTTQGIPTARYSGPKQNRLSRD
jgi:hypothetical protein